MPSITHVSELYECAATSQTGWTIVGHPLLENYSYTLQRLRRELGEAAQDPAWLPVLRPLGRFRFLASTVPLPAGRIANAVMAPSDLTDRLLPRALAHYPHRVSLALEVARLYAELSSCMEDPSGDVIRRLLRQQNESKASSALIVHPRAAELVADAHNKRLLPPISLVSPLELGALRTWRLLIVVGASRWYPFSVFSAPRANEIRLLLFDWLDDSIHIGTPFLGGPAHGQVTLQRPPRETTPPIHEPDLLTPDDVLPPPNPELWRRLARKSLEQTEDDDMRAAILLILGAEHAVFLEADAVAHVVDLTAAGKDRVQRARADEVGVGTYVLLRTEGGRDYVAKVADGLLGHLATDLRSQQARWKAPLRASIALHGIAGTIERLRQSGATHASYNNVRYWLSDESFRPEDDRDFLAILEVGSLQHDSEIITRAMANLDSAHRRAGFRIRTLLLQEVERRKPEELAFLPERLDFQLPDVEGGVLSAFRVEARDHETMMVPYARLGRPFVVDDAEWLA